MAITPQRGLESRLQIVTNSDTLARKHVSYLDLNLRPHDRLASTLPLCYRAEIFSFNDYKTCILFFNMYNETLLIASGHPLIYEVLFTFAVYCD